MNNIYQLHDIGRIPLPGDNVAIAIRKLGAGTQIEDGGQLLPLTTLS